MWKPLTEAHPYPAEKGNRHFSGQKGKETARSTKQSGNMRKRQARNVINGIKSHDE